MTQSRGQAAAGGDAEQNRLAVAERGEGILDVVELYRMAIFGRQAIADRDQVETAASADLGADIVVRIEAAEDEAAAVQE